MSYTHLLSPYKLGKVTLQNRVVVLPYGTTMVDEGVLNNADLAHYDVIAGSGVGLIITGGSVVHKSSTLRSRKLVEVFNERNFERLQTRARAIHGHGVALFGQILHVGREMQLESEFAPSGPSAIRSPRDPYPPHELSEVEIEEIVQAFGGSAAIMQRAGYDGVEIHGAHGYLVTQFLSPASNLRIDRYGGSLTRRMTFLLEIIDSIRRRCGDEFGLGVRLSADEEIVGGLEVEDTVRIATALAKHGSVDVLNITMGVKGNYVKDMSAPDAVAAKAASRIRSASGLPVIVGQRISHPDVAERLLAEGTADLIGMARAFFADPDWMQKVVRNEVGTIRPCLNLNQDCRTRTPHLHCSVNPRTGRELRPEFRNLLPARNVRRVAVIGGGPAGLDAALVAAERGHLVTVFEASDALGGQFLLASSIPYRNGMLRLVDHQVSELRRLSVDIRLRTAIDTASDLKGEFDVAIVATGAMANPVSSDLAGSGVCMWLDVLRNGPPEPTGSGRALFVEDGTGFWWNYGVAEALIKAGWRVIFATPSGSIGNQIPVESMPPLMGRLAAAKTEFRVLATLHGMDKGNAMLEHTISGEYESIPCDLVVIQTGRSSNHGPADELRKAGIEVHCIGDCVTPRRVSHAVFEAQRVARTI